VQLVGFIIKKSVTMQGHMIVKFHMKCQVILFIANQPLAKIIESPVHVKVRGIPPSTMCVFSLFSDLCAT